ncbi:MAG: Omp28-related outer membrane protein [Bacteroidales bacterium]|nr:Omp28-related outer membrane protein [Candidatus Liminaster caballi]
MKKFFSFAALLLTSLSMAFADEAYVGYCEGNIATATSGFITGKTNMCSVECAIYLPATELGSYAGAKLTKIRVGIPEATAMPETLTGWVRLENTGENITSGTVTCEQGWNVITLDQPLDITSTTNLWVGYSFSQKKKLDVVSFAGPTHENGCWWRKASSSWASIASADYGSLSIEAVVEGDNLPQWNIELKPIAPNKELVKLNEGQVIIKGQIRNRAAQTITGINIDYTVSGDNSLTGNTGTIETNLASGDVTNVSVAIPLTDFVAGNNTVTLTAHIEGQEDCNMADNTQTCSFGTFDKGFVRMALIEEFTTENCPNCPSAITRINSALDGYGLRNKVVWIEHHNGYYTDQYTAPESNSYLWFYTGGGTYAPAMMVDRTYTSPYCDDASPVGFPNQANTIAAWIKKSTDGIALVGVEITNIEVNGTTATVSVKCEKSPALDAVCPTPRINIFVVEDELKSNTQSGYSGTCTHEGVFRACNGTWGQTFTWDGEFYSGSFDINLKSTWVTNNMRAVAFISSYDSTNRLNCQIYNTTQAKFTDDFSTAITTLNAETEEPSSVEFFNLDGTRASDMQSGKFLIHNGKLIIIK